MVGKLIRASADLIDEDHTEANVSELLDKIIDK